MQFIVLIIYNFPFTDTLASAVDSVTKQYTYYSIAITISTFIFKGTWFKS